MKSTEVSTVEKAWLSNHEAQKYIGVGVDFFKRLRVNGEIPFYKVGKTIFYKKKDIDKLLECNRII